MDPTACEDDTHPHPCVGNTSAPVFQCRLGFEMWLRSLGSPSFLASCASQPRVPMSPRTSVPRALSGLIPALGALCSPASRWSSTYNKGCFLSPRPFLLRSHHPRSLCPLHHGHWPTWILLRTQSLLWFSQQRRPGLSEGI